MIQVNAMGSVTYGGMPKSALHFMSSYMNHSCDPNAYYIMQPGDSQNFILFEALRDIKVGEAVTITFVLPDLDYAQRQELLWYRYNFARKCKRRASGRLRNFLSIVQRIQSCEVLNNATT